MTIAKRQTHIRVFKTDKDLLERWMKKKNIKSQAYAIRRLIRRK